VFRELRKRGERVSDLTTAIEISKWFMTHNSQVSTATRKGNIKLQKLLYYAKAMYFAVHNKPLFSESFEAWENGPVVRDAYVAYRYKYDQLEQSSSNINITEDIEGILKIVNYLYGHQTTDSLIDLTHREEPWKELEDKVVERSNPIITDTKIMSYYSSLKDLYEIIDEEEIENTVFENINGNVFSYDKRYVNLTQEDIDQLVAYGNDKKDRSYAVEKDEVNGLVVY